MMLSAEEKLKANFFNGIYVEIHSGDFEDIKNIMIEFAKIHCIEQAKRCYEASRIKIQPKDSPVYLQEEILVKDITDNNKTVWVSIDKDSILNAYDLDNIK